MIKKQIDEFLTISSGLNISIVVEMIEQSTELLDYVIEKSINLTDKHSWRYAWVIDKLSLANPLLIEKYLTNYYLLLPKVQKDGHIREILKIISQCNIPEEFEVDLYDQCIQYITVPHYSLSVKYNAIKILAVIIKKYPEMLIELKLVLKEILPYCSINTQYNIKKTFGLTKENLD